MVKTSIKWAFDCICLLEYGIIRSDFDLLYMLSDYEDEITDALEDDESLIE